MQMLIGFLVIQAMAGTPEEPQRGAPSAAAAAKK
jgi:hypothetical protein